MSELHDFPTVPDWQSDSLTLFEQVGLLRRSASFADVKTHCAHRLCFLATPYPTRQGALMLIEASVRAARWSLAFLDVGVTVVSPVIQMAEMIHSDRERVAPAPDDAAAWSKHFDGLLCATRALIIPPIPGWRECPATWGALRTFLAVNRPVFMISETELPAWSGD